MKKSIKQIWENIKEFFKFLWDIKLDILLILLILFCIGFFIYWLCPNSAKKNKNEKLIYRNEKLVIVGANESQGLDASKFHNPVFVKTWLVQRVNDSTQFTELSSLRNNMGFYITNELWYAKGIGDTLYFDYIRKDRFFTIKKQNHENTEN